ncbi:MAG: hypothetical protein ACRC20_12310 [Segniliparus sp.]|uniref:hypothetical protein n=1 Tax=Segniliparus sp. TaxID=2804064 RepID=UPI003F2F3A2C
MPQFTTALSARGLAALFGAVLFLGGCGHSSDKTDDALGDAASCGNIHFKSRPSVVFTEYNDKVGGVEFSVRLVVDVPNADTEAFEKLSDLPEPTPGPPAVWSNSFLKDKALSEGIKASSPEDFQHVIQERASTPYSRLVVIQKTPRPDTRIYIYVGCG